MKCTKCDKRKGKRVCPALGESICSLCCGEKRVAEIPCPVDCAFLSSGQSYHWLRKYVAIGRSLEDPRKRQRVFENSQRYQGLLSEMEKVIVGYAHGLKAMGDQDVLEAVNIVRDGFQSESRGVLFEPSSSSPLIQGLVRELRSRLEAIREQSRESGRSLRCSDLLAFLEVLEAEISFHLQERPGDRTYLLFVARNHPDTANEERTSPLIIVP